MKFETIRMNLKEMLILAHKLFLKILELNKKKDSIRLFYLIIKVLLPMHT